MRFAPEILPVVSILTFVSHVTTLFVVKRAPDGFEMEHIKVSILLHLVQQIDRQFVLAVSKGTQISKVAVFYTMGVAIAELGLVLFRVIKRLDAVVSFHACVTIRTFASLCILAHLRAVRAKRAPPVFVMVEEALLLIVSVLFRAGLCLKEPQVKESNAVLLSRPSASCF